MSIQNFARSLIPTDVKHFLSSFRRTASRKYFSNKFLGHELFVYDADNLSRGWYGKEWTLDERTEFEALRLRGIPRDALIFDIGAHQGIVSILLKRCLAPDGRVVALELDKKNVVAARKNIGRNEEWDIEMLHAGISNANGWLRHSGRSNSTLISKGMLRFLLPKVQTTTIDALCSNYGVPYLIYLDVEGAEIVALEGASKALHSVPRWFIELHGDECCAGFGGSNSDVINSLRAHGYTLWFAESETEKFVELRKEHGFSGRGFLIAAKEHP